jgi:Phosphatidylinositol N-acetylglucosaminyltransferase
MAEDTVERAIFPRQLCSTLLPVFTKTQQYVFRLCNVLDAPSNYLRNLANVRLHTYEPLIIKTLPITQHISALFLFIAIFILLRGGVLDPRFLVWGCIAGFLVGCIAWERVHFYDNREDFRQRSKWRDFSQNTLIEGLFRR